jgi:hypothetical protein
VVSRLSNITVEVCEQVAQTVYSLHKTATRKVFSPHLVLVLLRNVSCEWKISMAAIAFMWQQVKQAALGAGAQSTEVLCELRYELPAPYKMPEEEQEATIALDLWRFTMQSSARSCPAT